MGIKDRLIPLTLPDLVRRVLLGWLLGATLEYIYLLPAGELEGLASLQAMQLGRVMIMGAMTGLLLVLLGAFWHTEIWEKWCLPGLWGTLSIGALTVSFTWPLFFACLLSFVLMLLYALKGWQGEASPAPSRERAKWGPVAVAAGLGLGFLLFVSAWTVARVRTFSAPTFDFGIFSQMFHNMKTQGLPLTTVERDGLLSHFAVHFSPIYYLLLPFYCLVPRPETLQVLQAAVLASGAIPMWLIAKHHGMRPWERCLMVGLLLLYPALAGGTGYDLHENCFLTPLLLWLMYGLDKKNLPLTVISALLTLMVKEDAAVYVAVVGLYALLRALLRREGKKAAFTGLGLLGGSVVCFILVTTWLARHGDGVMTYRYDNFIYDGSGSLFTVIKAVVMSPMKAVFECVDREKLAFMGQTLLPLLGIPLLTRRYERYILLIPYILINLMSDYTYQHDIFFQYVFGSSALLLYLTAANLGDRKPEPRRLMALGTACAVSLGLFCGTVVPKSKTYFQNARGYEAYYAGIYEGLATVPEDASVTAATFYTVPLSQRELLYDIRYTTREHILETDYVVVRPSSTGDFKQFNSPGQTDGYDNLTVFLEKNGYTCILEQGTALAIFFREG